MQNCTITRTRPEYIKWRIIAQHDGSLGAGWTRMRLKVPQTSVMELIPLSKEKNKSKQSRRRIKKEKQEASNAG